MATETVFNLALNFIHNNFDLIDQSDWKEFYSRAVLTYPTHSSGNIALIGQITKNLLDAGVDPIAQGLTKIPPAYFGYRYDLNHYNIPKTIKIIATRAFCYSAIDYLIIPDNVQYVHNYALANMVSLVGCIWDAAQSFIPECCFSDCSKLEELLLPKTIKMIRSQAFQYCIRLEEITYQGTKDEWINNVEKELNWYTPGTPPVIMCLDDQYNY